MISIDQRDRSEGWLGTGAFDLWGETETVGLIEPGEEKASGASSASGPTENYVTNANLGFLAKHFCGSYCWKILISEKKFLILTRLLFATLSPSSSGHCALRAEDAGIVNMLDSS